MTNEMTISLSPKEKEIVHTLYVEGKTIPQARYSVFISERGIKKRLEKLREKCGLDSNKQLLHFLTKNNLI